MTPEQKQAHAESLRTGVNFVTALMPGAWIPKAVDYAKNLYAGQQYKDVMAKEAAKNEADRVKSESNNLMSMIKDTNQTTPYSAPQGDPAQQARARAQTQVNADMTRMSANDQAKQDARVAAFDASRESTRGGGGGGMGGSNSNPGDPGRGGGGAHLAHGGIAALPLYKSKTGRSPKKPK
jgi:hypothetical protein